MKVNEQTHSLRIQDAVMLDPKMFISVKSVVQCRPDVWSNQLNCHNQVKWASTHALLK